MHRGAADMSPATAPSVTRMLCYIVTINVSEYFNYNVTVGTIRVCVPHCHRALHSATAHCSLLAATTTSIVISLKILCATTFLLSVM